MIGPICPGCNAGEGRHYSDCEIARSDAYESGRKAGWQEALVACLGALDQTAPNGVTKSAVTVAMQNAVSTLKIRSAGGP